MKCSSIFLASAHPGVNLWIFNEIYHNKALKESSIGALYHSERYPDEPDQVFGLPLMDAGENIGSNVGQMIWGWLIVPMDGEYTFFRLVLNIFLILYRSKIKSIFKFGCYFLFLRTAVGNDL